MKHKVWMNFWLAVLILQACGLSPAVLAATAEMTAAQTQTAAPTNTAAPTLAPTPTEGQTTGTLEVHAFWAETGEPVVGVELSANLPDFNNTVGITDANGLVSFANLAPDDYSMSVIWNFDGAQDVPISCPSGKLRVNDPNVWFTTLLSLNAGSYMLISQIGSDIIIRAGEKTTLDLEFHCEN